MSTTASTAVPEAPWRSTFVHYVGKMDQPAFVLSTIHAVPNGSYTTPMPPNTQPAGHSSHPAYSSHANANSHVPYVPHSRYCIYRGMWGELPENKHNDAPKNERVFESDMPTFTTDARMLKVPEIFGSSAGFAEKTHQASGTGGGGPVEAVWWYYEKQGEELINMQWRIKGQAFVVGPDIETESEPGHSGINTVKAEVGKRMRLVQPGKEGEWSWGKELTAHFGNLSPGMRGTFKAPPPGQPLSEPYSDGDWSPGAKVEDLHDEAARKNFRTVIIRPEVVEHLDIGDPNKAKRSVYTYTDDGWSKTETWP